MWSIVLEAVAFGLSLWLGLVVVQYQPLIARRTLWRSDSPPPRAATLRVTLRKPLGLVLSERKPTGALAARGGSCSVLQQSASQRALPCACAPRRQ